MKTKILVIDDEEQITRLLNSFLTKNGFQVIQANSGEEAIRILGSEAKPDLVLTDLRMPKITGFDVLKSMQINSQNIPVIILTGSFGRNETLDTLKEIGHKPEDVCDKPIDLFVLLDLIRQKLKKTA